MGVNASTSRTKRRRPVSCSECCCVVFARPGSSPRAASPLQGAAAVCDTQERMASPRRTWRAGALHVDKRNDARGCAGAALPAGKRVCAVPVPVCVPSRCGGDARVGRRPTTRLVGSSTGAGEGVQRLLPFCSTIRLLCLGALNALVPVTRSPCAAAHRTRGQRTPPVANSCAVRIRMMAVLPAPLRPSGP